MTYTKEEILEELDKSFRGEISKNYPQGKSKDIRYNFFLDLENGYCEIASSKIHLYGDHDNWAIIFEMNGYNNRSSSGQIELIYIGNCIDYPIKISSERNYISNMKTIILINPDEFRRIQNGSKLEDFELISPEIKQIKVRGNEVEIEHDIDKYLALGIEFKEEDNPKKLIGFGELIRYISEINPEIIKATENDIRMHIPMNLKKILTIDEFHYTNHYEDKSLPSELETYNLIADVLINQDSNLWKPKLKSNNHWSNWESGSL